MACFVYENIAKSCFAFDACLVVVLAPVAVGSRARLKRLLADRDDAVAVGDRGVGVAYPVQQVEVVGHVAGRAGSSGARAQAIGGSAADTHRSQGVAETPREQQVDDIGYVAGVV